MLVSVDDNRGHYQILSPDGGWIGFFGEGTVKKVPAEGSSAMEEFDSKNLHSAAIVASGWSK
jgi:hypothetical protein